METPIQKGTIVDASGSPLLTQPGERPLDLRLQALVKAELADAKHSLHLSNDADMRKFADDYSRPWRKGTLVMGLLLAISVAWNWVFGPDMIKGWVKDEVRNRLIEPNIKQVADDVITEKMGAFVAQRLVPLGERTEDATKEIQLLRNEVTAAQSRLESMTKAVDGVETKLRGLEPMARGMDTLPDGRITLGGLVVGRAWRVFDAMTNLTILTAIGRNEEAFDIAQDCVKRYEESQAFKGAANVGDVSLSGEAVVRMYLAAAQSAINSRHHAEALKWAQKTVELKASPENNLALAIAHWNLGHKDEVASLINQILKAEGADVERFEALLIKSGLPRPHTP